MTLPATCPHARVLVYANFITVDAVAAQGSCCISPNEHRCLFSVDVRLLIYA